MRQLGETLTGHQSDTSTIRTTHASARVRCRHVGEGGDSGSGDCLDAFRTDARTFSRPAISHLPPAGQLGSSNSESAARPRHRGAALSTLVYVSDCLLVSRPPAIHRQLPPPMNSSRQRYSVCSETPAGARSAPPAPPWSTGEAPAAYAPLRAPPRAGNAMHTESPLRDPPGDSG